MEVGVVRGSLSRTFPHHVEYLDSSGRGLLRTSQVTFWARFVISWGFTRVMSTTMQLVDRATPLVGLLGLACVRLCFANILWVVTPRPPQMELLKKRRRKGRVLRGAVGRYY